MSCEHQNILSFVYLYACIMAPNRKELIEKLNTLLERKMKKDTARASPDPWKHSCSSNQEACNEPCCLHKALIFSDHECNDFCSTDFQLRGISFNHSKCQLPLQYYALKCPYRECKCLTGMKRVLLNYFDLDILVMYLLVLVIRA